MDGAESVTTPTAHEGKESEFWAFPFHSLDRSLCLARINKAGVPAKTQGSAPYTECAKLTQRVDKGQVLNRPGKLAFKADLLMPGPEKGSTMQIISPPVELQREDCYN